MGERATLVSRKQTREKLLWKIFSFYIRAKAADDHGRVCCFTCGNWYPWKGGRGLQAGHYQPRSLAPTKYDERNVHPQCTYCNFNLEGNKQVYARRLDATYGEGAAEQLAVKAKMQTPHRKLQDINAMITFYRQQLKAICEKKGLESPL